MTRLPLTDKDDNESNNLTCSSTDDEWNTEPTNTSTKGINRRPSDEDIEASKYWDYKMVPSIHKYGNGRPCPYTKEDIELWGRKALDKWQTGEQKWCTRVQKPKPQLEGWAKRAQENGTYNKFPW